MKLIKKIQIIMLSVIIIILTLLIGKVEQSTKIIIQTIIIAVALLYIIIKKIKGEKNLIIKSKIDVGMLLLALVTFVPILAGTYYSLEDSIDYCLQYLAIFSTYILVRNIVKSRTRSKHNNKCNINFVYNDSNIWIRWYKL